MAVLSVADRLSTYAVFSKQLSDNRTAITVTKADLKDAVNAIDDWVEANQVSFNTAIPLPARTALTPQQKARLLWQVVQRRFEVS